MNRGRMGRHPTRIPVAISTELEGGSVRTEPMEKICLPYDQIPIMFKLNPRIGFRTVT